LCDLHVHALRRLRFSAYTERRGSRARNCRAFVQTAHSTSINAPNSVKDRAFQPKAANNLIGTKLANVRPGTAPHRVKERRRLNEKDGAIASAFHI